MFGHADYDLKPLFAHCSNDAAVGRTRISRRMCAIREAMSSASGATICISTAA